ncbi:aspartate carbamoyltransferase, regulatory subunit [Paludibacter propionicigenes WB4]|jgi:aspartate carbamoyltransferase regulatory subunit|uniref:Aspartate carbamoyltransferase regulatory chain n=1 Tax=Paludibacter propionicigenes (strain DSM 17365 / JCM 13257 / WB4) TaxID=694427 RepID=E4T1P8_PALPW|nr:aspartate carbamoyltransferase regulatory subunit [Paludibacter propionicigenes]ADQ78642.1 aspartate carbamoyltransferase, regulatory subunit [Paludibacter propionicigenes WB4]
MEKKLKVAALCNGTVIDHIPSDKLFKVVSILHIETSLNQITLANNLESAKIGSKGLVKISDRILEVDETNKLALIAPNAKINIIRDYQVVEKRPLILPEEIREIVQCANPNCITNHQPVTTRFHVLNNDGDIMLKCHYCEREVKRDEVKIK